MPTDCSTILQPLAQSQTTNLSNLPSLNYTNQDFYSMKTRLIGYIKQQFPNDFADFVESDLGIMLIENWAFIADTLSFKMDQIVNEIFIDTVTELENAIRLSQLVGFQPTPPIGATAMFSATVPSILATDLVIPSGIALDVTSSSQTITFELFQADALNNPIFNQDIIIQSGSLTNTSIVGIQGVTKTDTFTSSGAAGQTFGTTVSSVLFDSVMVSVDGNMWNQVKFFTDSQARNEFIVQFTSNWTAFVIFGNGVAGRVPSQGSSVVITYRVGGGTIGNIVTGAIQLQRGFTVPGFNFVVPVTFTNYTSGQFGFGGDTIDDIRRKLPAYIQTQNRAVTGADYKTTADQFVSPYNGQIGKATAVLRNYGCAGNIVDIFVLALDGTDGLVVANDQLKTELSLDIEQVKMLTDFVCIRDGVVISVDVVITLFLDNFYQKFQQSIQANVLNRVNNFFALTNWDYGQALRDTAVIKSFSDMKEINDAQVSFVTNDVTNNGSLINAAYYQIIRDDNVTINMIFE